MASFKIKLKEGKQDNVISFEKGVLSIKKAGYVTLIIEDYEKESKVVGVDQEALLKKYEDVVWIWSAVGGKSLNFSKDNYNIGYSTDSNGKIGKVEQSFYFPELLEGGGIVYAEAFSQGESPSNSIKVGILIQAVGTPEVLGVRWERYNKEGKIEPFKSDTKIPFGVTVILHIYTKGLFGQLLDIKLMDEDVIYDDELPPFERTKDSSSNNVPEMPDKEDAKIFKRIVDTYTEDENLTPIYAVRDELITNERIKEGSIEILIPKKNYQVQKVKMEIYIDPFWKASQFSGEDEIEIYAMIKHRNDPDYKKFKKDGFKTKKFTLESKLTDVGNKAVLIGESETDVADFYHCKYTEILVTKKGESDVLKVFDSSNLILKKNNPIILDVIAGKKETYYIEINNLDIDDCEDQIQKHTKENRIKFSSIPTGYSIDFKGGGSVQNVEKKKENEWITGSLSVTTEVNVFGISTQEEKKVFGEKEKATKGKIIVREDQIEFDSFFPYSIPSTSESKIVVDTYFEAMKYFWLPNLEDKLQRIKFTLNTCAYVRDVNIIIYPDIKWTLMFGFNVEAKDIEALNKRGLKSPLGIFESLQEEKLASEEKTKQEDQEYHDKNKHLNKITEEKLKEGKKKYKLMQNARRTPPVTMGELSGFFRSFDRIQLSLAEEHYGGKEKNELNEEFFIHLWQKFKYKDLIESALSMLEGDEEQNEFRPSDLARVAELRKSIVRETVKYNIFYPKIAFAGSWFYETIDSKEYPSLVGRQGLGIDINLSASPLVGTSIRWDILELVARKHPIAYALLKTVDILMDLLADDDSCFNLDFIVSGQIKAEVGFQHNMLAGFKDISAKGGASIQVKLELKLNLSSTKQILNYKAIAKLGFSAGASSGLGTNFSLGVDRKGVYMQTELIFEGILLEFSAMIAVELRKEKDNIKAEKVAGYKKEMEGKTTFAEWNGKTDKFYLKS